MKTLKERFEAIKKNNQDKDWNDLIFRDVIVSSLSFCCNQYIEELQKSSNPSDNNDLKKDCYCSNPAQCHLKDTKLPKCLAFMKCQYQRSLS